MHSKSGSHQNVLCYVGLHHLVKVFEDELKWEESDETEESADHSKDRIMTGRQRFTRLKQIWNLNGSINLFRPSRGRWCVF